MSRTPALTASQEDYLEAIFHIVDRKQAARAKDIAERLNVTSSSVTGALHSLADRKLINYAPYDIITLTDTGRKAARDVVRRHRALRDFFVKVFSVDEQMAEDGACRMEHAVPKEIVDRFIQFVDFIDRDPEASGALMARIDAVWARSAGAEPGTDGSVCAAAAGPVNGESA